jgi:protein-S-isoprenylcysteine O-methyltransferase Ste14
MTFCSMATRDLIGRIALLGVFGAVATLQTKRMGALLTRPDGLPLVETALLATNFAFVMLILCMTILRLRPLRSAEGVEPRIAALAGTFLSFALVVLPPAEISPALRVVSLVMQLTGFVMSIGVLFWLGRSFSIAAQARRLVTTGPYAIVRHPLYLCEELTILGIALTHLSVSAVVLVLVQWRFQLHRMAYEEQVLASSFDEWAAYAAATPRLIPRLLWYRRAAPVAVRT